MRPTAPSTAMVSSSSHLTIRHGEALRFLLEAAEAASKEGLDVWQFAVEIGQLRVLGLSHTDLRCLLCWNYLEHAQELTTAVTGKRSFRRLMTLVLPQRTCFVLTAEGRVIASRYRAVSTRGAEIATGMPIAATGSAREAPRWDAKACRLWWRKHLIKEFRRPAANQELVLAALEEEGWPPRIDDPLPPSRHIDPKVRLHDTIKALNRHHLQRILHFGGDGKGRGIQWILVE